MGLESHMNVVYAHMARRVLCRTYSHLGLARSYMRHHMGLFCLQYKQGMFNIVAFFISFSSDTHFCCILPKFSLLLIGKSCACFIIIILNFMYATIKYFHIYEMRS